MRQPSFIKLSDPFNHYWYSPACPKKNSKPFWMQPKTAKKNKKILNSSENILRWFILWNQRYFCCTLFIDFGQGSFTWIGGQRSFHLLFSWYYQCWCCQSAPIYARKGNKVKSFQFNSKTYETILTLHSFQSHFFSPYNTRVWKLKENTYEIRTASAVKKPSETYDYNGTTIEISYGDHAEYLKLCVQNLEKAVSFAANENQVQVRLSNKIILI